MAPLAGVGWCGPGVFTFRATSFGSSAAAGRALASRPPAAGGRADAGHPQEGPAVADLLGRTRLAHRWARSALLGDELGHSGLELLDARLQRPT